LVLADPPVKTPLEAARSGKLIALAIGNIDGGEVCGKEALPILAREILATPHHPLLKDLIIVVVPNISGAGNERFSNQNRPGQDGPKQEVGQRASGRGIDLNRDFIKVGEPETRALVRFFNTWNPHLFIDTHTTNESFHRYAITYEGPKNPAGDPRLIAFVRSEFFPAVTREFEKKTGLQAYYYGSFNRDHTQWTTFPAEGRYGTNYAGLRNRLSVLTEAYAHAPHKDRVLTTREFVRECLIFAAAHKDQIIRLIDQADQAVVNAGQSPGMNDRVAIRSDARPLPNPEPIQGYLERDENGRHERTETPKDYPAQLLLDFVPTEAVTRPYAYLLPASCSDAATTLKRHGLAVQELREDIELDIEAYHVGAVSRQAPRGWDDLDLQELRVTPCRHSQRVPAGTLLVKTAGPLGNLAVYLLEPRSEDGLAAWKLFGTAVKEGALFPVLRLPDPTPISTAPAEPLAEERKHGLPITFELAWGRQDGGMLSDSPVSITWLDPAHWLQIRDGKLYKVEATTGRSQQFVDPLVLVPALKRLPSLDETTAQAIASELSFDMDPAHKAFLFEHNDDLYYATFDGSSAVRLTDHPSIEQHAQFSPDGGFVAFIRDHDLHVVPVAEPRDRALSSGGSDTLLHGIADWVYYEEIFNRHWPAIWWSPDSKRIAFMEFDDAPVGRLTMLDDTTSPRKVEENKYPRAGEPNPKVRIGIVDVAGGPVRWADLSSYSSESLLVSEVGWWADSSAVYCTLQDRTQTWLDLVTLAAAERTPVPRRLFRDATKAWIAEPDPIAFLPDGTFLWCSERDGWKHLYHYAPDGTLKGRVTSGPWEVRSLVHVDAGSGWIYFTATRDDPLAANLYRVKLGGPIERLTQGVGSYQVSQSPDDRYYVATWSHIHTPARVKLHAADGTFIRNVDTNPSHHLAEYRFGPRERVSIRARDGFLLEGELILPPDLDPARKYPVWFMTYGGPHMPRTSNSWMGGRLWDQALASDGFIVFRLDPRSASGKGAVSAWTAYKRLGVQELEDIKDGIAWLKQRPYVDGSRIGMSGHSYGGFMTSFAMTHCDLFAAGIAGAPVTDWRDYDTIYTERFMGLPQDNPEGYDASSVVKAARNLKGKLLLVHGAIDDNVSVRNSMRLVAALQAAGKDFELMIYPEFRHGINSPHYSRLQLEFIHRTLSNPSKPAAPSSSPVARSSPEYHEPAR
jgi:dipeptidyl aminopeptidase/acylaminoacyl peptidase